MWDTEVNDVYLKLDSLYKLKAKKIVKGTGLLFKSIFLVENLVTKTNSYHVLNIDEKQISFKNPSELFGQLIFHCRKVMQEVKKEREHLEHHKDHDLHFDAVGLDPKIEMLWCQEYQLEKFIDHLNKLLDEVRPN